MIQLFQIGGGVYFNATGNPYLGLVQEPATTSSKSSSKSSGLVPDKLLEKLTEKGGIPVDVDSFYRELALYEHKLDIGLPVSKSELYGLQAKANRIIQQASYLKHAETLADKNNSFGEIAVGTKRGRGNLYVLDPDSKEVKAVDIAKYDMEKDGPAMTVSELIEHRKFNPTMSFDTDLTQVIGSNFGMDKITSYVLGIINTVGQSSSTSEAFTSLAGFVGKEAAKRPTLLELLDLLLLAEALDKNGGAIFKNKDVIENPHIQEAFKYIALVLPSPMKTLLVGRYVAEGGDAKQGGQYIAELIIDALASGTSNKEQHYTDYEASLSKAAGMLSDLTKRRAETPTEMFFNQHLDRTLVTISDPSYKNKTAIAVMGNVLPSLTTDSGTGVGKAPLDLALVYGGKGMGKYLDTSKVWIGTDKVSSQALSQVIYRGDRIANVWMPTTSTGDIDWASVDAFSEAEQYILANNITSVEEKNRIHTQCGSPVRYSEDGTLSLNPNVAQFMMIHGVTNDDMISSNNKMYKELDSDTEDLMDQEIKEINKAYKTKIEDSGWFTDLIETNVFIKINPNAGIDAAFYSGNGSQVPKTTLELDMEQQFYLTLSTHPEDLNVPTINGSGETLYAQ